MKFVRTVFLMSLISAGGVVLAPAALLAGKNSAYKDQQKFGPGFRPDCLVCQQHAWEYKQKKKKKKNHKLLYTMTSIFSPGSRYLNPAPPPHQHVFHQPGSYGYAGNGGYGYPGNSYGYHGNSGSHYGSSYGTGYSQYPRQFGPDSVYPGRPGNSGYYNGSGKSKSKSGKKDKKKRKKAAHKSHPYYQKYAIQDYYPDPASVMSAVAQAGVEFNLIVAIDSSSPVQHGYSGQRPYTGLESALNIFTSSFALYDSDQVFPSYMFGASAVNGSALLDMASGRVIDPWRPARQEMKGLVGADDLLAAYRHYNSQMSPSVQGSWNQERSMISAVEQALNVVRSTGRYHILVLFMNGDVSDHLMSRNMEALALASRYPLSVIAVGMGSGPFYKMNSFDNDINARGYERRFDNFQFVSFEQITSEAGWRHQSVPAVFLRAALSEIPAQYRMILDGQRTGEIFRFNNRPGFWQQQYGGRIQPVYY